MKRPCLCWPLSTPRPSRLLPAFLFLCAAFSAGLRAADDPALADPGLKAARAAKSAEAARLYRALAATHPRSPAVWFELGETYYGEESYAEALDAYRKARELDARPDAIHLRLGRCLAKLKRHAEAEAAYRLALAAAPDAPAARFGLAAALFNQDRAAEALPLFETLADRADDWGKVAQEYMGHCYFELRQYERAIALLEPRVARDPEDETSRWLLAKSLYKTRRYEEALPHLERIAAGTSAQVVPARFYRAACLEGLGRLREAEAAYGALEGGGTEWAREAQTARRGLAGKPYRATLDLLAGYDTGIVQAGDNNVFTGGKDYFLQAYAEAAGRVWRGGWGEVWLGAEHFSLNYSTLRDNDYFEDSAKAELKLFKAGPFEALEFKYALKYAQLDYQPYHQEHLLELSALYRADDWTVRFGANCSRDTYYRDARTLEGPDARFFFDVRRRLPLWDHFLRLRVNLDQRWSRAEAAQRFTQRARVQYRAQVWRELYAQLEGLYRRDDYPQSQGVHGDARLRHRTDHRASGELRFDYQFNKDFSINWGYLYEFQDSRRRAQEYERHQTDLGVTLSF